MGNKKKPKITCIDPDFADFDMEGHRIIENEIDMETDMENLLF